VTPIKVKRQRVIMEGNAIVAEIEKTGKPVIITKHGD
jgi:hypothetical protein